jgi:hypothetical protein
VTRVVTQQPSPPALPPPLPTPYHCRSSSLAQPGWRARTTAAGLSFPGAPPLEHCVAATRGRDEGGSELLHRGAHAMEVTNLAGAVACRRRRVGVRWRVTRSSDGSSVDKVVLPFGCGDRIWARDGRVRGGMAQLCGARVGEGAWAEGVGGPMASVRSEPSCALPPPTTGSSYGRRQRPHQHLRRIHGRVVD